MAEAETTEAESSNLRVSDSEDNQIGKAHVQFSESVQESSVGNNSGERNGLSVGVVDSSNQPVFGGAAFGSPPVLGSGLSPAAPSSSSASTSSQGGWQPSYRPPTVFGGSASSQGNPFAGTSSMKQPGVSRSGATITSQPSEALIAPGRLNSSAFCRKNMSNDSDDEGNQRPISSSILAPPRIVVDNKDNPLATPKFSLRPSALPSTSDKDISPGNPFLKPATLQAPTENSECEEPSSSDEKSTTKPVDIPDSSNVIPHSSVSPSQQADSTDTEKPQSRGNNSENSVSRVESSSDGFVFGQNLADRITGVSSSVICTFGASNHGNSAVGGITANSGDGFVFGQNLADRVVNVEKSESAETGDSPEAPSSTTTDKTTPEKTALSLAESAREYQAKHESRPELEEVEVKTGEEEESNVLQANCKLFVFETSNETWVERGRGQLRVNDIAPIDGNAFHSRLVMRTHGSLRLILNTKIWAGMTVERASSKSIRVTASDGDDGIKVFLISATPKDSENILSAIDWRVQRLQVLEEKKEGRNQKSEKRKADSLEQETLNKKQRQCPMPPGEGTEESNDSNFSHGDPETETSNGSRCSSLTAKSEDD